MPPNRLADETSAYLRQHQDNPVDWWPWCPEAFAEAGREARPLLVSIGYSACHWCHVMAHESFEDPHTAALMNRLFVNVKVDREERPDVDQIYMDTLMQLSGHGGWPLTVFCTPDGRPFHAGTYYPPEPRPGMPSFRQVLEAVSRAWSNQREDVEASAGQILRALAERPAGTADAPPGRAHLETGARRLLENADRHYGGFGSAPKFPTPTSLDLLLAAADVLPEPEAAGALDHVVFTCREMSRGGLYDHLAGGFHRYTVDGEWVVPHFEKMLYDQGQLLATYAEAWRRSGDDDLLWPIHETAEWLRREMSAPDGGWYASTDADSEGEEGRYFVWTPDGVSDVLGAAAADPFCAAYDVTHGGSFEHGTSVLRDRARKPREQFADERAALLRARNARVAPGTDPKRVAAWQGLTISGLARAAGVLDDETLLRQATDCADFVLDTLRDADGRLLRVFDEERARIRGFLDDYAAMLAACLDLHRAGAGDRYLTAAIGWADAIAVHFFDPDEGDLFLTPDDGEPLALRPRSDHDGATPHSTGLATLGLVRAAALGGRDDLREIADTVLRSHAFALERAPAAFPTLLRAAALAERGTDVALVIAGSDTAGAQALALRARRLLGPEDAVVVVESAEAAPAGLASSWVRGRVARDGRATAYVCRGVTCSLPITEPEQLRGAIPRET